MEVQKIREIMNNRGFTEIISYFNNDELEYIECYKESRGLTRSIHVEINFKGKYIEFSYFITADLYLSTIKVPIYIIEHENVFNRYYNELKGKALALSRLYE